MNSPEKPSSSPVEPSDTLVNPHAVETRSINGRQPTRIEDALAKPESCRKLEKAVADADILRQIVLLSIVHDIAINRAITKPEPTSTYRNAITLLNHLQHKEDTTPLVKIIANHLGDNLQNIMQPATEDEGSEETHLFVSALPMQYMQRVSTDTTMFTDIAKRQNVVFMAENGEFVVPGEQDNSFAMSQRDVDLIQLMHTREIEGLINKRLGLELADVSLPAQTQLLKLLTTKDEGRFNSICSALKNTDEKNRLKLAEAFFAVGFGADFGDSLIDIANSKNFSPNQLGNILDNINSCRKSIHNITELYKDFDNGDFARQYSRAANERLTDVLAVFRRVANSSDRKPIQLGWAGNFYPDYRNANEALEYETKSLEIISGTLSDVQKHEKGAYAEVVIAPEEGNARTVYNFYSPNHGYVLAYTRPLAAERFDASFEYGKEDVGVEASMSLITNPKDPFTILDPFRPKPYIVKDRDRYDPKRMDKISAIRIDREGRFLKEAPNSPYKSPIRRQGTVSVDLAAINDRSDTPSGKIARLISAGNALRAMDRKTQTTLNHNTNYFDQAKYGTESGFEQLVNYIDSVFTKWCNDTPPKSNEGYVGLLKTAARKRGRKALGEVS